MACYVVARRLGQHEAALAPLANGRPCLYRRSHAMTTSCFVKERAVTNDVSPLSL